MYTAEEKLGFEAAVVALGEKSKLLCFFFFFFKSCFTLISFSYTTRCSKALFAMNYDYVLIKE